ncbi:MAG: trypsin-like peptidase domain-containing protein [Acidobacteria bacterium]|nr:trypsin-like peptidase domain-containing protein [Acidobacteriota bacterium]
MKRVVMHVFLVVSAFLAQGPLSLCQEKPVAFETVPPGAQVEVNGSVDCTTPCSIQLDKHYFGGKAFAFSKHADHPVTVRLLRAGCAPKSINITIPLRWRNGYYIGMYTYYEVPSAEFHLRLDAREPSPENATSKPNDIACSQADRTAVSEMLEHAKAAMVSIVAGKQHARGFLISSDGLILTDGAGLIDHRSATVTFADGTTVKTSKSYYDEDRGMLLLKTARSGLTWLRLSKNLPQPGDDVFTIGPSGTQGKAQSDQTNAVVVWAEKTELEESWVLPDRDLAGDDPGAPLLNREGEVVGMKTHRDMGLLKTYNFWGGGHPQRMPWIAGTDMQSFVDLHFKIITSELRAKPPEQAVAPHDPHGMQARLTRTLHFLNIRFPPWAGRIDVRREQMA